MQVPYEYRRSQTLASKFALLALTQRQLIFRVIASASVAIPLSKVRGIYSVLYSDGLPRSRCSPAKTKKQPVIFIDNKIC